MLPKCVKDVNKRKEVENVGSLTFSELSVSISHMPFLIGDMPNSLLEASGLHLQNQFKKDVLLT